MLISDLERTEGFNHLAKAVEAGTGEAAVAHIQKAMETFLPYCHESSETYKHSIDILKHNLEEALKRRRQKEKDDQPDDRL